MGENLETMEIISKNLTHLMEIHKINNRELAEKLDVSESTVGKWINKKSVPKMGNIEMMAKIFGVKKSDILEDKNKKLYSQEERELIDFYRNSSSMGQKRIIETAKDMSRLYPLIPTRQEMLEYFDGIQYAAYGGGSLEDLSDEELYNIYKVLREND